MIYCRTAVFSRYFVVIHKCNDGQNILEIVLNVAVEGGIIHTNFKYGKIKLLKA